MNHLYDDRFYVFALGFYFYDAWLWYRSLVSISSGVLRLAKTWKWEKPGTDWSRGGLTNYFVSLGDIGSDIKSREIAALPNPTLANPRVSRMQIASKPDVHPAQPIQDLDPV